MERKIKKKQQPRITKLPSAADARNLSLLLKSKPLIELE
jgi:hypothetical protein